MTDQARLAVSISCHAWNADKSRVAVCPNNNEVHIYSKQGSGKYNLEHTLKGHDAVVTGIDWGHQTNRIVTCSQDRNAYVWSFQQGQWKPTLVILRLNRAATRCKWSPNEDKFAVASGALVVSVCHFDKENDWWVSKHIKKGFTSTILDIAWHPNNILLATACADGSMRVVSAFVRGVDSKEVAKAGTPYGTRLPFGNGLKEVTTFGWVHACKWSPSGNQVAFVGHDSKVHVLVAPAPNQHTELSISYEGLPFRDLLWLTETTFVCAGHDCKPVVFSVQGGKITKVKELDGGEKKQAQTNFSARQKFMNMDKRGGGSNAGGAGTLNTKHQNCVTCLYAVQGGAGNVSSFSTTGLDGNIVVWKV